MQKFDGLTLCKRHWYCRCLYKQGQNHHTLAWSLTRTFEKWGTMKCEFNAADMAVGTHEFLGVGWKFGSMPALPPTALLLSLYDMDLQVVTSGQAGTFHTGAQQCKTLSDDHIVRASA